MKASRALMRTNVLSGDGGGGGDDMGAFLDQMSNIDTARDVVC